MSVSKSPHRNTFQRDCYIEGKMKEGVLPDPEMLDYYLQVQRNSEHKFDDPKSRESNLEYDLRSTDWILEKVRGSDVYAQHLYAALCNNDFTKLEVIQILKEEKWSCSWRYAGGIIADMQEKGDYVDWYCSGSWGDSDGLVHEGEITDEIRSDLKRLGWAVVSN